MKRDRIVILLILGLAVTAAVFAGWFRWSQGHLTQVFWGVDVAQQIRFAPQVELIWLESPFFGRPGPRQPADGTSGNAGNGMTIDGTQWSILKRADITTARGLIHARQSLVQDATFQWDLPTWGAESSWTHALVISDPDGKPVTLLFDLAATNEGFVRELNASEKIQLTIPQGFKTFFSEQGDPDSQWYR